LLRDDFIGKRIDQLLSRIIYQTRAGKFLERLVKYRMYIWRFVADGRRSCPIIFNDFSH